MLLLLLLLLLLVSPGLPSRLEARRQDNEA